MAVGCGYYSASIIGCVLVVAVLFVFSFFDRALDKVNQLREYKITYPYEENQQHKYEDMIKKFGLTIFNRTQSKTGNIITGSWVVRGSEKKHHQFIDHILRDASVTQFDF